MIERLDNNSQQNETDAFASFPIRGFVFDAYKLPIALRRTIEGLNATVQNVNRDNQLKQLRLETLDVNPDQMRDPENRFPPSRE